VLISRRQPGPCHREQTLYWGSTKVRWSMPDAADAGDLRFKTFEFLERGRRKHPASQLFDLSIVCLILLNVSASVVGTVPSVHQAWGRTLDHFDMICVAIFTVEYVARIWSSPANPRYRGMSVATARLRHATTPLMIVDFFALMPFVIQLLFHADFAAFRVLRIVRFYRLARYVPAVGTIGRVIASEWRRLFGTLILFTGLLLFSGVLMYIAEGRVQPDKLGSVPDAMWWAVVTLSTVGYGDIIPVTTVGKLIASITMFLGIMFLALPVSIIASGFQEEIKRRDFVVNYAMVARVPLFSQLDVTSIAQLAGLLTARKVAGGTVIVSKGDEAEEMFFIVYGKVEVELPTNPVILGEGDYFGEIAIVTGGTRTATVRAAGACELLQLKQRDFRHLVHRNPQIGEAVRAVAKQRLAQHRPVELE
jgi:voltage-gated potassium channel